MVQAHHGSLEGYTYAYQPGRDPAPRLVLLLLHGTGGNEWDLMPMGEELVNGAPLVSPRGRVNENGMARFFRRFALGQFDEADIDQRVEELEKFLTTARERHGLERIPLVAVGYSNGANMAAAFMLMRPGLMQGAILLRGVMPYAPREFPTTTDGGPVLICSGQVDPYAPPARVRELAEALRDQGRPVDDEMAGPAHGLTARDMELSLRWLDRHFGGTRPSA